MRIATPLCRLAAATLFTIAAGAVQAFTPGTYEIHTPGKNGNVGVVTTFSKHRIESIKFKDHYETPYIGLTAMNETAKKIIDAQSLAVDTVSGATMSSAAVLRAVALAAEKAGVKSETLVKKAKPLDPAKLPAVTLTTDVVVVGAGGTGLAAAAAALDAGAKVLVLEKEAFVGGSTALSGGAIMAPGSRMQRAQGIDDSPESAAADWAQHDKDAVPGGSDKYPDAQKRLALLKDSTETVHWLSDKVGLKFAEPRPFGFGGAPRAHAPKDSPVPASGKGSSPAGGRFITKALADYVVKHGGKIQTKTAAYELLRDKAGRVTGVLAHDAKKRYVVNARSVVLATGGFARNIEMMAERLPRFTAYTENAISSVGDTGEGLAMAIKAGAAQPEDFWVIALGLKARYPEMQKAITGAHKQADFVLINERGTRFVNEARPYAADQAGEQRIAWLILDSSDADKGEILKKYLDYDTCVTANDFEMLARRMGLDAAVVSKTLKDYNEAAKSGVDKAFHKPAEYLKPLTKAPYYAVIVTPTLAGTIGGVVTDANFKVLNDAGKPVAGLWAGGELANRPYYARSYESGSGLDVALTSGRLAGTDAAKAALAK